MAKENTGALFANDKKEKDTHPDFKGSINIDGKEYWLSGWNKEGKNGPFVSLAFTPKQAAAPTASIIASKPKADAVPFNDEIPF